MIGEASVDELNADRIVARPSRRRWLLTLVVIPGLLGLGLLILTHFFRVTTSETYDESIYLILGMSVHQNGNFTDLASPMCPPLPILLEYWLPAISARSTPLSEPWTWEVPGLIRQARLLTSVEIGVPLILLVYAWMARRRGWVMGTLAAGLVVLSPTVLAAASVATTDACFALFALIALLAIHYYQRSPGRVSFLVMGVALGLALAAKQTAIILLPVVAWEFVLRRPARRPGATGVDYSLRVVGQLLARLAILILVAFLVDWACYGFGLAGKFDNASTHVFIPVIVPMIAALFPQNDAIMEFVRSGRPPLAIDSLIGQLQHASLGHPAFLMGERSSFGWRTFFPIALALKSTPAELVLFAIVGGLAARRRTWAEPVRRIWLGTMLVLLGAGISSSLNIGHRYMLLCYPLVVLLAFDWLGDRTRCGQVGWKVVGPALLVGQVISLAGIAPHYLAYFNGIRGGPSQGYRYLVDSSLDWGQDLPALRTALEARGYRKVALGYFGLARPEIHGLRFVNWLEPDDPELRDCDWLAISATTYQCVYERPSGLVENFSGLPFEQVNYSIFLFDLKDPRVRSAWNNVRSALDIRPVGTVR